MKFLSDILAKAGLTVDGVVTLNNTATGQTPDANDNSTKLATTAWVRTFVQPYSLPIASSSVLGGIKVGNGLSIDATTGVLSTSGGTGGNLNFRTIQEFTATAGQTTFTIAGGYTVGYIEVLVNGVYISESQYTATNGTTIVLTDPTLANDIVTVFLFSLYNLGTGSIYTRNIDTLTATAGQTTFSTSYIVGQIDVYYNGSKLTAAEYTATNGTTIILAQAAKAGDIIEVVTYLAGAGVNANRTITIDGVAQDLTANRTWNILPTGGAAGEILAKNSATNYDVAWIPNYTSTVQHTVKAAVAVTKGQAVYVSSADGTNMIVSKASNASEQTSSKTLGLVAQDLAINGQGFVVTEGLLAGLNTSTANAGDPVWLGTDGNLIFGLLNKPTAPAHLVFIGVVTRVQSNNGEIFVKVQNGFELDELHDLSVKNASDGDMIKYVASTGLWTKIAATTTNITEGTNLYYTQGRFDTAFGAKSTTNLTEGTNLYYTDARARAAISVTGSGSYDSATGVITVTGGVTSVNTLTGAVTLTTTNIGEGTNLYYTTARANSDFDTRLATKSTANLAEGTNLYYTTARANSDFDTRLATKSTTNLAEGTNLYYTDARVGTYLTANSYATQSYVSTQIANLVDSAPTTLDTLNELAAALGDDPNFATTVSTSIGTKVPQTRTITINGTAYDLSADRSWSIAAGVTAFNTRTGAITLTSGDVTGALGYTPYNATNPSGYITSSGSISGNAATATTATNFNNGYAYSSGSTVYVDTLESINTNDWLELVYYGGVGVRIGTGVNGSKALYAGSLYDDGNRVYSAGNPQVNITGNAATASSSSFLTLQTTSNLRTVTSAGIYRQEEPDSGFNYTSTLNMTSSDGRQQLTIARGGDGMKFRGSTSGSGDISWSSWKTVWHSDNLTNLNQLTNGPGYITGVTNISGYAQSLLSPNGATVVAADSAMPGAGHSFIHTLALGPGGNDGHILGMTWASTTSVYGAQIFLDTDPNDIMAIRSRSSSGVWTGWKTVIHSGTIGSQSVSYASTAGSAPANGGTADYAHQLKWYGAGATPIDANTFQKGILSNYYGGGSVTNIPDATYGSLYNFGGYDASSLSLQLWSAVNHASTSSTRTLYFRMGNNLGFQNDWKTLLDNTNYSSYALPLSGGTISGNLLLNTSGGNSPYFWLTTDQAAHYIKANSYWIDFVGNANEMFRWYNSATLSMKIDGSNNLTVAGDITAYSSDRRLKNNIKNIESGLQKVLSLNGVTFDWDQKALDLGFVPTHRYNDSGVIAQEVEVVLPQAVRKAPFDDDGVGNSKSGENYLTVQYEKLAPLFIEAIKELKAENDALKEILKRNNII
jgi:hypothetical protein